MEELKEISINRNSHSFFSHCKGGFRRPHLQTRFLREVRVHSIEASVSCWFLTP